MMMGMAMALVRRMTMMVPRVGDDGDDENKRE